MHSIVWENSWLTPKPFLFARKWQHLTVLIEIHGNATDKSQLKTLMWDLHRLIIERCVDALKNPEKELRGSTLKEIIWILSDNGITCEYQGLRQFRIISTCKRSALR